MNPNAAVFRPTIASKPVEASHSNHEVKQPEHHSPHRPSTNPSPPLHTHTNTNTPHRHNNHVRQMRNRQNVQNHSVRINKNIPHTNTSHLQPNNTHTHTTGTHTQQNNMQLPVTPLFNTQNVQQWQQWQQQQQNALTPSPNTASISPQQQQQQYTNQKNTNNNNNTLATHIQNQQLIYQQMQTLTDQQQQLHVRITNVLQPQLSELSDQMQTALFNCNHVTQPEYYAGLQNQHLILSQTMKETTNQLNTIRYQYQWYQQLLIQYQQSTQQQQQQHAQHAQQQHTLAQIQIQQQQSQSQSTHLVSPQQNHKKKHNNKEIITSPNHTHPHTHTHLHHMNGYQQLYEAQSNETQFLFNSAINHDTSTAFNNKEHERRLNITTQNTPAINTLNTLNHTAVNVNVNVNVNILAMRNGGGKKHTYTKQDIFERKLCVLICKLTPDRFDKVLAKMLEFMDNHVQTQNELKIIVDKILRFTLNQPYIASLTAKLFYHFYDYLPRLIMTQQYQQHLWDTNDTDISVTFRKILIVALEKLFNEFIERINKIHAKEQKKEQKKEEKEAKLKEGEDHDEGKEEENNNNPEKERLQTDFFALMEIIGEIYNVDLIHVRVLRKGIFDNLLVGSHNIVINIEAMCVLFKSCGKKLDLIQGRFVDKYISKIYALCGEIKQTRTARHCMQLMNEVKAIRSNNWVIHRKLLHNQKYKTVKFFSFPLDEIREEEIMVSESKNGYDYYNDNNGYGDVYGYEYTESKVNDVYHRPSYKVPGMDSLTKCYGFDSTANKMIGINENIGFIKCMEFGYEGSSYTLGDDGTLIVHGNNKFGQLGIENELILMILKAWDVYHIINKIRDISYLISSFVDGLKYIRESVEREDSLLIMNDITSGDQSQLISRGIASRHRFILTTSDQLYGAGCNTFNQLGFYECNQSQSQNNTSTQYANKKYWVKINYFTENNIKLSQIECGYSSSTFLSEDGCIYTVGYSSFGNLGLGDKQNKMTKITKIFTIKTKIQHISCGFDHTLCINEYRYVLSFGDNGFGQLGHAHLMQNRRQKPKEIEYFHKNNIHAIEICCGAFHSLVLDCNGKIYCFGYNLGYQCHSNNDDEDLNISTPKMNQTLHNIDKITNIKCGAFHNIVETQQNQWYLWGDNRNKQCLVYDSKSQFIKIPTKYHKRDISENESIIDMFPGYDQTIIFTLQN